MEKYMDMAIKAALENVTLHNGGPFGAVVVKDGKIIEHSDGFRLSTWAAQALGWKGVLLGWTGFMKRGIQKNARRNLAYFIQSKNASQN